MFIPGGQTYLKIALRTGGLVEDYKQLVKASGMTVFFNLQKAQQTLLQNMKAVTFQG